MRISATVNGDEATAEVDPSLLLVHFLRDDLGLTGTKVGCDTSVCGACTVLLDDDPVKACAILAVQLDGHAVDTIEGLGDDATTAVRRGFHAEHAVQCGFCSPGMVVSAAALLRRTADPTDRQITEALEGNLCRCTGYISILRGTRHAAALLRGETPAAVAGTSLEVPTSRVDVVRTRIQASDVEVV